MSQWLKSSILGALTVITAVIFWHLIYQALYIGGSLAKVWILPAIGFLILGILLGLLSLLIKSRIIAGGIFVLSLASFLLFFKTTYFLLVALIGFWLAYERIGQETRERLKLQIHRILFRGLPIYFACLFLLITVAYYHAPALERGNLEQIIAPKIISLSPEETLPLIELETKKFFAQDPRAAFVPFGLAFSLFIALNAISGIFIWLTILFIWLIIILLIKIRIINQKTETCKKTIIKF